MSSQAAKKAWKTRRARYGKTGKKGKLWIAGAVKRQKRGALSRQLGIPEEKNIPLSLLSRIKKAKIGTTVTNPTKTGNKKVKVTRLLKQRVVLAVTLRKFRK